MGGDSHERKGNHGQYEVVDSNSYGSSPIQDLHGDDGVLDDLQLPNQEEEENHARRNEEADDLGAGPGGRACCRIGHERDGGEGEADPACPEDAAREVDPTNDPEEGVGTFGLGRRGVADVASG